jgi:uncharacterized membrane protein
MTITKQLAYSAGLSIVFLLVHILILALCQNQLLNLVLIIAVMIGLQLSAFTLLRKNVNEQRITFGSIFSLLCLTQLFSVILLTLYSAYSPWGNHQPVNLPEVIASLVIFAGILPLIVTTITWFASVKKRNPGINN